MIVSFLVHLLLATSSNAPCNERWCWSFAINRIIITGLSIVI